MHKRFLSFPPSLHIPDRYIRTAKKSTKIYSKAETLGRTSILVLLIPNSGRPVCVHPGVDATGNSQSVLPRDLPRAVDPKNVISKSDRNLHTNEQINKHGQQHNLFDRGV